MAQTVALCNVYALLFLPGKIGPDFIFEEAEFFFLAQHTHESL